MLMREGVENGKEGVWVGKSILMFGCVLVYVIAYTQLYHRIHSDVSSHTHVYHRILGCIIAYSGVSSHTRAYHRILRCIIAYSGVSSHTRAYHRILGRIIVEFLSPFVTQLLVS